MSNQRIWILPGKYDTAAIPLIPYPFRFREKHTEEHEYEDPQAPE